MASLFQSKSPTFVIRSLHVRPNTNRDRGSELGKPEWLSLLPRYSYSYTRSQVYLSMTLAQSCPWASSTTPWSLHRRTTAIFSLWRTVRVSSADTKTKHIQHLQDEDELIQLHAGVTGVRLLHQAPVGARIREVIQGSWLIIFFKSVQFL